MARVKVHRKLVPILTRLATVVKEYVRSIIDTSLKRLQMKQLNLVPFHWWDYAVPRYLDVAIWLNELRQEGKIANFNGTNFDTAKTMEVLNASVPLTSMQVQYSLPDS